MLACLPGSVPTVFRQLLAAVAATAQLSLATGHLQCSLTSGNDSTTRRGAAVTQNKLSGLFVSFFEMTYLSVEYTCNKSQVSPLSQA